ncbi:transcriptional regulator LrhA [Roseomonas terrae]|jgi:DNA-binding transcriptional LysR family regulator|uniref:Transcriptional regulator LrhA n=1 Tax=Neoroseomonas terrae TaxID=424799 RepID=A0ABS5ECB8_9PROT|nr:LysR substrate-binding domain-containing protein [Neoroseomonas terrae]MBR0648342.1 transcriptional regulator LrhA [Neoroseomonas terrae]
MAQNFDLDLLRSFVAVADGGSFATAAERVHRTQSAVSQQMQRLEEHAGRVLFVRDGRRKRLSEDGRRLLVYARRIVALNDEAAAALDPAGQTQLVRLGANNDVVDTMLPEILGRIAQRHRDILLEIRTGRSPFLMEALERGELDLAISTRDHSTFPRLVLRRSPTAWFSSAGYVPQPALPVPLVLSNEPSLFRSLAIQALDQAGCPWRLAYLSLNLGAIRAAVRAGLGITARNIEMLTPDLRVLGDAEGLPPLPAVTFSLFLRTGSGTAAKRVFDTLAAAGP